MLRPVQVRGEGHAILVDLREPGLAFGDHIIVFQTIGVHGEHLLEADTERHHLETATVSEGRCQPVHETTQPTGIDDICTRLQVEVIGVSEYGLSAERCDALGKHGLDGRLGAHGHEGRRPDQPVRGHDHARAAKPPW